MNRDISFLFASEIRLCTLLIGIVEMAWAFTGIIGVPQSLFKMLLADSGLEREWFFVMVLVGALTSAGAIFPWRSGRHIGLFLSALLWLTMTGVFMSSLSLTPVTVTMPIFAVFAVGLIYVDAKRKPREKLDS